MLARDFATTTASTIIRIVSSFVASVMPAWLSLPRSARADEGFAQISTVSGISHCRGYYLEMDFNFDCVIDFEHFAILANKWLVDQRE